MDGRLAVSDDGDPGLRTFVDIPADPAARHVDAIPNGHFQLVDARSVLPSGWTLERSDPAIRFVPAASLVGDERAVLEIGSAPTTTTPRTARLSTTLALPHSSCCCPLRCNQQEEIINVRLAF